MQLLQPVLTFGLLALLCRTTISLLFEFMSSIFVVLRHYLFVTPLVFFLLSLGDEAWMVGASQGQKAKSAGDSGGPGGSMGIAAHRQPCFDTTIRAMMREISANCERSHTRFVAKRGSRGGEEEKMGKIGMINPSWAASRPCEAMLQARARSKLRSPHQKGVACCSRPCEQALNPADLPPHASN